MRWRNGSRCSSAADDEADSSSDTSPDGAASTGSDRAAPGADCGTDTSAVGLQPDYSGCVPNDPVDVDCAGGSGNGPSYVRGPVQVIGSDVYRLDTDHDGIGCE